MIHESTTSGPKSRSDRLRAWLSSLLVGLAGLLAVLVTLDDPGLTVDEPINVAYGKRLVWTIRSAPDDLVTARGVERLWRKGYDHPPLGRLFLGLCHHSFDTVPDDAGTFNPRLARAASALAYALAMMTCVRVGWSLGGGVGGLASGIALLLMPRLFGHAHFASLDMIAASAFLLGLAAAGWSFADRSLELGAAARWGRIALSGIILGLALGTKLTNILLVPAVGAVVLARFRKRGLPGLVGWGLIGAAVFVATWPWLWPFDLNGYSPGLWGSWERIREYLAIGLERPAIYVWYFGFQFPNAERAVPWHYAWTYFLLTIPVGLQLIGLALGLPRMLVRARDSALAGMVLAAIAVILGFFTLPIDRYDGERLFLAAFPPWAIVIGVGCQVLVEGIARFLPRGFALGALVILLALQVVGPWKMHPFELSYFSRAVGGLSGAVARGLEATYWGDTLSEEILGELARQAEPGEAVVLIPSLHSGHAPYLTSVALREKGVGVVSADDPVARDARLALLFHRGGYLVDPLPRWILKEGKVVAEVSRDGVWLARVYRLPKDGSERRLTQPTASPAAASEK